MAIKVRQPTSPGQRGVSYVDYRLLTKKKPERSLTVTLKRRAGRDRTGRISVRHRGGGSKRRFRIINFGQKYIGLAGEVKSLEYDPYRSAFIALIQYPNHQKAYILAPNTLKVGQSVVIADQVPIKVGNRTRLEYIPPGVSIHNVELMPGGGGKIVRSAGAGATIQAKEGNYATVKLPSGEIRKLHLKCFASIGVVSNPEHNLIRIGKAGRRRLMGIRPSVRGKAMHPAAHPHGGGEGVNPIGLKQPKTPWGKPARGVKTRHRRKPSSKFIVKRRK